MDACSAVRFDTLCCLPCHKERVTTDTNGKINLAMPIRTAFQLRSYIAFSWLFDSIAIERHRLQRMVQYGKRWQTKYTK